MIVSYAEQSLCMYSKLVSTLDALNWPAKKIQPDDLDFSTNEKARAFKAAFLDICKLEQV